VLAWPCLVVGVELPGCYPTGIRGPFDGHGTQVEFRVNAGLGGYVELNR
jgi:hypothetical protein